MTRDLPKDADSEEQSAYFDWEKIYQELPMIDAALEARGDPAHAAELRRILPPEQSSYGTRPAAIRSVVREWLKPRRTYPLEYILMTAELLWSMRGREQRIAALTIIRLHPDARDKVDFGVLETWSRDIDNSEIADYLAGFMGRMLETTPRLLGPVRSLSNSANPWLRRQAIMTLLVACRDPAWEPGLAAMAERLENDQEPRVREAVQRARARLKKAAAKRV